MIKFPDAIKIICCSDKSDLYKTGVYWIKNKLNGKLYIGSASCITKRRDKSGFLTRFRTHFYTLQENKHKNIILQNSWNIHGYLNFEFKILEFCDGEECLNRELYYLNKFKSYEREFGYNICKNPLANMGPKTPEQILEIKKRLTGIPRTYEVKEKLSTPILQYDFNGNFIKEWYSISEASRITGIQRQDIGQCCLGNGMSAGNHQWKYKLSTDYPLNIGICSGIFRNK